MKYEPRDIRLERIKKFYRKVAKEYLVEEQLKSDPDWDIRGTVHCPKCDTYLDYCFADVVNCKCNCIENKEEVHE